MTPDHANALFELGGALLTLPSILRAWRTKLVIGVHLATPIFFTGWGVWNLYYYFFLDQWWSWAAGLILATVNIFWLSFVYLFTPRAGSISSKFS